jgi:FkbM family methyltransferase
MQKVCVLRLCLLKLIRRPYYRMFYVKTESFHTENPVYQKIPGGDGTFFFGESRVAKDYATTGLYERTIIDWASAVFPKEDKACIDVGAHMGMYTVELAKKAKHVYGFECSPRSFNYYCANLALRDLNYKVTKYNVALGNPEEAAAKTIKYLIRDPLDGGGNGCSKFDSDAANIPSIDVPITTLDSYGLTNINFIKIDVEGHEKNVIQGAVKTIEENDYPKILFESWPERCTQYPAKELREKLFEFIRSLEYKIMPVNGWDDMFLAER